MAFLGRASDLGSELIEEVDQELSAFPGEGFACLGLHGVLEAEELGVEVVDAIFCIIDRAIYNEWVFDVVKVGAHVPAEHKTAAESDRTKGVNTISVLQDFCLEGSWSDVCGKTVCFDGVVNGFEMFPGIAVGFENGERVIGSQT